MFSDRQLKLILDKADILAKTEFDKIAKEASTLGKKTEHYLAEKKIISTETLYESAANFYKIPFIKLKNQTIRKDVLFFVPEKIASIHQIIAFDADSKNLKLAVTNPGNIEILEFIKKKTFCIEPNDIHE